VYYPTFREYSRHHRDSSPVNDHQGNLDGHDNSCAFMKNFHHWTANVDVLFPLFLRYLQYPRLDRQYHHTWFNLVTHIAIYSLRDIPSPWPSHMLQYWMNLTKWVLGIFPSRGRTNPALGAHASTYFIGIPKNTFSVTVLPSDDWCNQSSRMM
jgi:hypothetical protein